MKYTLCDIGYEEMGLTKFRKTPIITSMDQSTLVNACAFLLCFGVGFLFTGKRPVLAISTRLCLIGVFASALWFAATSDQLTHALAGATLMIANVLFVAFASIDLMNWRKRAS